MNWLDWVILIYVGLGVWAGWRDGLAALGVGLAGYLLGWWGATVYAGPLEAFAERRYGVVEAIAAYAGRYLPVGTAAFRRPAADLAEVISFLVIFGAVGVGVGILGRFVTAPLVKLAPALNRVGGAVLGGGERLLVTAVVLFALVQAAALLPLPFSGVIAGAYRHSALASPMIDTVKAIDPWTASPSSFGLPIPQR